MTSLFTVDEPTRLLIHGSLAPLLPRHRKPFLDRSAAVADWPAFVETARRHRAAPLIGAAAREVGIWDRMGDEARGLLRRYHLGTWGGNRILIEQFLELARGFSSRGLPLIGLKGTQLILDYYPDPAFRPMGDLDILVPVYRLDEAVRILIEHGFVPGEPGMEAVFRRYHFHYHFRKPGAYPVSLELHWDLSEPHRFQHPIPGIWERSLSRAGGWRGMDPCDLLLHLVAHLAQNGRVRCLSWLVDMAVVLHRTPGFPWDRFIREAGQREERYAAFLLLGMVRMMDPDLVPPEVLDVLRPGRLRQWIWFRIERPPLPAHPEAEGAIAGQLSKLFTFDRALSAALYLGLFFRRRIRLALLGRTGHQSPSRVKTNPASSRPMSKNIL